MILPCIQCLPWQRNATLTSPPFSPYSIYPMLPFEFTRPSLLILIIPIAIVLGVCFVRSLSDFPRPQRIASLVTRSAIVILLVLALAGLTWLHRTNEQFVLFVVDQSLSVGENAEKTATEFLKQAAEKKGSRQVAYLPFASAIGNVQEEPLEFGARPSLLGKQKPPADGAAIQPAMTAEETAKRDGTSLAAAIEAAAGYMPPGYVPQIVVLTDGNQTIGNATDAASRDRIPVSTIPLPTRSEPEVQVSEVSVPAEVREGEPFFVDVTISSNHDDEALVEVFRGVHKVIGETRKLTTGENKFRFQQSVDNDRMAAFKVRVSGLKQDTLLDNNADSGLVYTAGKPRVLIIESDPNLI